MVVAQLVKQFLLTPEISCANPVIGNILVKKWAIRGLFFFYFRLFYKQLTVNMFNKSCRWLDSNPGPLILEATALSTAPHHCPSIFYLLPKYIEVK